ncbi:hypothetical protein [Sphingomonas turrisvirgatae]|uniref:hypothetical protein n=1 Tax=Sphingomonas turrisvirgatae TaxID=1888892 RepID=UPI0009A1481A|nr:hypothetical protein [Sphingomonas turrisvirgatae]
MTGGFPVANRRAVLRRFILSHRLAFGALLALALAMRVMMPAGFMPAIGTGKLMVLVCTEFGPQRVAIDIPGAPARPDDANKADQPCAFAGQGQALLPGADPVQIAAALAFILALGFAAVVLPRLRPARHAWPPLRGPPQAA